MRRRISESPLYRTLSLPLPSGKWWLRRTNSIAALMFQSLKGVRWPGLRRSLTEKLSKRVMARISHLSLSSFVVRFLKYRFHTRYSHTHDIAKEVHDCSGPSSPEEIIKREVIVVVVVDEEETTDHCPRKPWFYKKQLHKIIMGSPSIILRSHCCLWIISWLSPAGYSKRWSLQPIQLHCIESEFYFFSLR
jgi:hypothetical protein